MLKKKLQTGEKPWHFKLLKEWKVRFVSVYAMFCCSGNVDLVNRLLLDAGITAELVKIWKNNKLQ